MFCVKENLNDGVEIFIEINDENVFCKCPRCGCEVQVNLEDVFSDGEFDLFGTAVLCDDCTQELIGGERNGNKYI